jgi:hypothetical protein
VSPALAPPEPPGPATARLALREPAGRHGRATAWVLFAEARRRGRRRRLAGLAVSLILAAGAIAVAAIGPHHPPAPAGPGPGAGQSAAAGRDASRSPLVAWVDGNWQLHVGNLASRKQRVVTQANAGPATPLVQADGRVYWVDTAGTYVPSLGHWSPVIQELDLATGKVRMFQPGQWIFPSADGRQLYLSQIDSESLIEVSAAGSGAPRLRTLPAGWYLPGGIGTAVAGGIVVQSDPELAIRHPPVLGIWSPRTGRVRILGRGVGADSGAVISAYTSAGTGRNLLAWMPACRYPVSCPIRITNTATLRGRTLRSPLRYSFALGGAFSPDGRQLAIFVNRSPGNGGGTAQLAIVSTRTGTIRLVPRARFLVGEDVAWARWLPGGKQLIAGGVDRDYIVTAASRTARSLRFRRSPRGDIGYSAVVLPPGGPVSQGAGRAS